MTYEQLKQKYPTLNWKEAEEIFEQNPDDIIAGANKFDDFRLAGSQLVTGKVVENSSLPPPPPAK